MPLSLLHQNQTMPTKNWTTNVGKNNRVNYMCWKSARFFVYTASKITQHTNGSGWLLLKCSCSSLYSMATAMAAHAFFLYGSSLYLRLTITTTSITYKSNSLQFYFFVSSFAFCVLAVKKKSINIWDTLYPLYVKSTAALEKIWIGIANSKSSILNRLQFRFHTQTRTLCKAICIEWKFIFDPLKLCRLLRLLLFNTYVHT